MDFQMSLQAACLVSLRLLSDLCAELLIHVGSGPKFSEFSASYDHASASLRTRQLSLLSKTGEPSTELCQDWSRSGMIVGGMYFPLPRLVQAISATVSSWSLPTPAAHPNRESVESYQRRKANRHGTQPSQATEIAVKLILSSTSSNESRARIGGMKLTPEFLSFLMGYPANWLKPLTSAPAILSSRKSSPPSPKSSTPF